MLLPTKEFSAPVPQGAYSPLGTQTAAACTWLESNQLTTIAHNHNMPVWSGLVLAPRDAAYRTCSTNELQARVFLPNQLSKDG